jgi:hypothetical protein
MFDFLNRKIPSWIAIIVIIFFAFLFYWFVFYQCEKFSDFLEERYEIIKK